MNELNATIDAATLRHIVSTLARVDDQAIFEIKSDGISSRLTDAANAHVVSVVMPAHALDEYYADDMRVGVDLEWLSELLRLSLDEDVISIHIDHADIHIRTGMHDNFMELLHPNTMRKPLKHIDLPHTVEMRVLGLVFKRMIDYLAAIRADALEIRAADDNVLFDSKHYMGSTQHYHAEADCLTQYSVDARALYSTNYLIDIAKDVLDDSEVTLQFGDDAPVLMTYTRDRCELTHILAPRIETD